MNGPSSISDGVEATRAMVERDRSPKRRDVLRTGAAAGLLGLVGWSAAGTAQDQQAQNAFSYSLQEGDLFRVRFRPRDPAGNPATETIPGECPNRQFEEYQLFIVRAFRNSIDLGYRGLLAPQQAAETETPQTTPEGEETTPAEDETTPEETTTEAALQDETTTVNETTPNEETTTPEAETTPAEEQALPEIQLGEWYRVTSSVACANLNQLTLEPAEQPETTPGPQQTTTAR